MSYKSNRTLIITSDEVDEKDLTTIVKDFNLLYLTQEFYVWDTDPSVTAVEAITVERRSKFIKAIGKIPLDSITDVIIVWRENHDRIKQLIKVVREAGVKIHIKLIVANSIKKPEKGELTEWQKEQEAKFTKTAAAFSSS